MVAVAGERARFERGAQERPTDRAAAGRDDYFAPRRFFLVDADSNPFGDALKARRRAMVLDALTRTAPDLVLIESFPFGRRAFREELMPLLESGRKVAVSLRDIVVAKDAARTAEAAALVRRHVAAVLVHGDPRLVRLEESFPAAAEIADRVRYTGYVYEPPEEGESGRSSCPGLSRTSASSSERVDGRDKPGHDEKGAAEEEAREREVIVSAGGGAVGGALLRAALEARPLTRYRDHPWRLLAGPNLPAAELAMLEGRGAAVERFRGDFSHLLRRCAVSVSQAGYNTVLDLLWARPPCVLVPFAAPGETEQALRAARLGCPVVAEATLTPSGLAAAIDDALPPRVEVALDGAQRSVGVLRHMFKSAP
jgi:predicted glycosyltransferase